MGARENERLRELLTEVRGFFLWRSLMHTMVPTGFPCFSPMLVLCMHACGLCMSHQLSCRLRRHSWPSSMRSAQTSGEKMGIESAMRTMNDTWPTRMCAPQMRGERRRLEDRLLGGDSHGMRLQDMRDDLEKQV